MKITRLLCALLLTCSFGAQAADGHDHAHEPLHGGIVAEARDIDFELVARADALQLYLRDHGKAVDVSQASAKLTLLAGSDKQEVELRPAGARLEAKGTFKVGTGVKAVALVSLPGKPAMTVRFALK
jgi:hypothetical protein